MSNFLLLYLLDKVGLSPRDVKIQAMEPDAAGLAFMAGKIDVAVTWEPYLSEAAKRPDGHILITSADPLARGVIVDNLIVRDSVITHRREEVEGVVRAWFRAVDYMARNPEDSYAIIGRAFKLKPDAVAKMMEGVKLFDQKRDAELMVLSGAPHTVVEVGKKAEEIYYSQKLISNKPNIRRLIDASFIKTPPME